MAYVEQNPVRARLVRCPWRYRWSSAANHCGLGKDRSELLTPDAWDESVAGENWKATLSEMLDEGAAFRSVMVFSGVRTRFDGSRSIEYRDSVDDAFHTPSNQSVVSRNSKAAHTILRWQYARHKPFLGKGLWINAVPTRARNVNPTVIRQ